MAASVNVGLVVGIAETLRLDSPFFSYIMDPIGESFIVMSGRRELKQMKKLVKQAKNSRQLVNYQTKTGGIPGAGSIGATALHFAAMMDWDEICGKYDCHACCHAKRVITHGSLEIRAESIPIAVYLIQNGADCNLVQLTGHSPLHLASEENQVKVMEILIRGGANTEIRTVKSYNTPLYIAVGEGKFEATKCLLDHGALGRAAPLLRHQPLVDGGPQAR